MATYEYEDVARKRKNDEYALAELGPRFIAVLIDGFIVAALIGLLFGSSRWAGGGIGWVLGAVYYWYFWTRQDGQTLGKKLMNIRVIKADGGPLSDSDAILRYIGYYINSFVIGIGWIWALFDKDRQGWHDKIASTYVVKA